MSVNINTIDSPITLSDPLPAGECSEDPKRTDAIISISKKRLGHQKKRDLGTPSPIHPIQCKTQYKQNKVEESFEREVQYSHTTDISDRFEESFASAKGVLLKGSEDCDSQITYEDFYEASSEPDLLRPWEKYEKQTSKQTSLFNAKTIKPIEEEYPYNSLQSPNKTIELRRKNDDTSASTPYSEQNNPTIFVKSNIAYKTTTTHNLQSIRNRSPKVDKGTKLAEVGYYLRRPSESNPGIIIDHHQGKHAKFPGVFSYQGGRGEGVFNPGMYLIDLEELFKMMMREKLFPFLDQIPEPGKEIPSMIETSVSHLKGILKNYKNITISSAFNRELKSWEIHIYPT